MKKYYVIVLALVTVAACNSNDDKQSDKASEKTKADSTASINVTVPDTTSGTELLSGTFEITDYEKDNVKIELPKSTTRFTRKGEVFRSDGNSFNYTIKGDSILFLIDKRNIMSRSKIEFLDPARSSFIMKNSVQKTEFIYKKIN